MPVERQPRERFAPPAAESAGAVARRELRDRADVLVRERAEKDPVQRPVHDADAIQIARADHDVVVAAAAASAGRYSGLCERSASIWQIRSASVVRDRRAAGRRCTSVRARVGRCGASLRRGPDTPRRARRQSAPVPSGEPSSTTSMRKPSRARTPRDEHRQVLALVVGRDDDEHVRRRAHRRVRPASAGRADDQRRIDHGNPESLLRKKHEAHQHGGAGQQEQSRGRLRCRAHEAPGSARLRTAAGAGTAPTDATRYLVECSA